MLSLTRATIKRFTKAFKRNRNGLIAGTFALSQLLFPVMAAMPVSADSHEGGASTPVSSGGVTPYIIDGENSGGNRTCAEVGTAFFSDSNYYESSSQRFDGGDQYSGTTGPITWSTTEDKYVSWSGNTDGLAVIAKAGNDANVYVYDSSEGTFMTSDTELASPPNTGGNTPELSNITFCYNETDEPHTIDVTVKKYIDTDGDEITDRVAEDGEFDFKLNDGDFVAYSGGADGLVFQDVPVGTHTISESDEAGYIFYGADGVDCDFPADFVNGAWQFTVTEQSEDMTCSFFNKVDQPDPEEVTVIAHKIVCEDESLLPNWGDGQNNPPSVIDSNTASNFVSDHSEDCDYAEDWNFQWKAGNITNPELDPTTDPLYDESDGWNTFGPTDSDGKATTTINVDELGQNGELSLREVLQDGYIPFTYGSQHQTNADNVSAEFYCGNNIKNYDNIEWLSNLEADDTLHCVAWNVPEEQPRAPTLHLEKWAFTSDPNSEQLFTLSAEQGDLNESEQVAHKGKFTIDGEDGLTAGTVKVSEDVPEGWTLLAIKCFDTNNIKDVIGQSTYENDYELELEAGDDVTCKFFNVEESKVTVTKYNDIDQDGERDDNEPLLPDWTFDLEFCGLNLIGDSVDVSARTAEQNDTIDYRCLDRVVANNYIGDYDKQEVTDENGVATFNGLVPFGHYVLSEQIKEGWNLSSIDCEYPEYGSEGRDGFFNRYHIFTFPGAEITCEVGNYQDAKLLIEKSNDREGDDLVAGDSVTYTIEVTNPEDSGMVFDATVYDQLPDGVTYTNGSGTAVSDTDGPIAGALDAGDYVNPGPASWELGDLSPGEVVTLTYSATIDEDTTPGTYDNIAFVSGTVCENFIFDNGPPTFFSAEQAGLQEVDNQEEYYDEECPEYSESKQILGNVMDEGDDPFVESSVTVVEEGEVQGFVLGVSTLAETGVPAILPTAVGLSLMGTALAVAGGNRERRRWFSKILSSAKLFAVAIGFSLMVFAPSAAYATEPNEWRLSVVDLPSVVNTSDIELSYSVSTVDAGDSFEITLLQDGSTVDTDSISAATSQFGDSGTFSLGGLADGDYELTVIANNLGTGSDDKEVTQNVTVDTEEPQTPQYDGVEKDGNKFTLTFEVPAGSDAETVKIYSSTSQNFNTGEGNLVGEVAATPGDEQTFEYTAPSAADRYFAIVAVDEAGNQSTVTGDEEAVVTQTTTTDTGTTGAGDGNGETAGDTTDGDEAGDVQGDIDGAQDEGEEEAAGDSDGGSGWLWALVAAVIIGGGYYYFVRSRPEDL